MKKCLILLSFVFLLSSLVIAQSYTMELFTLPEDKIFEPGETIKVKVTLFDSNSNLVNDEVSIIFKDISELSIEETTIQSNNFEEITLPENALAGEGEIVVSYKDSEITENFFVSESELVSFEVQGEKLIVTNIGNTIYDKTIYITIGDTVGSKNPNLGVGESVSYRLVAPEGSYNIKVTDDSRNTLFTKGSVSLTGTGQVIGALDERASGLAGITGIESEPDSEGEILGMVKNSTFVYVFVLVVFGATILLAIERRYRRKSS